MNALDWESWARTTLLGFTRGDASLDDRIKNASPESLMTILAKITNSTNVSLAELPNGEGIGIFRKRSPWV